MSPFVAQSRGQAWSGARVTAAHSTTRVVLVLCLGSLVGGCGSAAPSGPSSAASYRHDVNALCRRASSELSSAPDRTRAANLDQLRRWDEDEKERLEAYVAALADLVPPPDLVPDAREFVLGFRALVRYQGEYLDVSREGTPDEVEEALVAGTDSAATLNMLARRVGIRDCVGPEDPLTAYGWQQSP